MFDRYDVIDFLCFSEDVICLTVSTQISKLNRVLITSSRLWKALASARSFRRTRRPSSTSICHPTSALFARRLSSQGEALICQWNPSRPASMALRPRATSNAPDAVRQFRPSGVRSNLRHQPFECPTCHRSDTLRYDIESVTPRTGDLRDGFTFDVKVTCERCPHKKASRALSNPFLTRLRSKLVLMGLKSPSLKTDSQLFFLPDTAAAAKAALACSAVICGTGALYPSGLRGGSLWSILERLKLL